jgi:hypothetical protein
MEPTQTTPTECITALQQLPPNPTKWLKKGRGYVDWKFSEVCQYLGYTATLEYVHSMHRWHDFEAKYKECELQTTYTRYTQALI